MPKLSDIPFALRVVSFAWAALTLVHFTIWALVCIIGGEFDRPWWVWFGVPPGVAIGALWWWYSERARVDA